MKQSDKKAYVRIQSSIDITVTMGLQHQDVTNPDAHIPDRLKINPLWPKATVLIKRGTGIYPSEIVDWATVQALSKDKIITIGEYLDSADDDVEKTKTTLDRRIDEVEQKSTKSLADMAEDKK